MNVDLVCLDRQYDIGIVGTIEEGVWGRAFSFALRVLTCFVSFASAYMPKLTHFTVRPSPTKLRFAGTPIIGISFGLFSLVT